MAGNKEGAKKARDTILAKDPDFYQKIGAKSWDNPDRSHETGFAKMDKEKHRAVSKKGGQKTKEDYAKKAPADTETQEDGSGSSE